MGHPVKKIIQWFRNVLLWDMLRYSKDDLEILGFLVKKNPRLLIKRIIDVKKMTDHSELREKG